MTIVSFRYGFVFLKTRKTAGSSIELSLGRYLGPEDLIVTAHEGDAHGLNRAFLENPLQAPAPLYWAKRGLVGRNAVRLRQHASAREIAWLLGRRRWRELTKIAFERNPWDRMVSLWQHRQRGVAEPCSFAAFIGAIESRRASELARHRATNWSNWPIYTRGGRVAVDRLGHFETLGAELSRICGELGLAFDGWLPGAKVNPNRKKGDYRQYYTPDLRDRVGRLFAREIALFGYEF